jgi:hypothetical protein
LEICGLSPTKSSSISVTRPCNVIERAFGYVKMFPLLQTLLPYEFPKQVRLIVAAFVIFNFIHLAGEDVQAWLPSYGNGEAGSHGGDAGVDGEATGNEPEEECEYRDRRSIRLTACMLMKSTARVKEHLGGVLVMAGEGGSRSDQQMIQQRV